MPDWNAIFNPDVPLLELFLRGTLMYIGLLAILRIVGQREAGSLGLHDLLVIVLMGEAAQQGLVGGYSSVTDGMFLVATIVGWSVVIDALAMRFPKVADIVKPSPKPLIVDGRLNHRQLRRNLMTADEVLSQLRLHGVEDISLVKRACIEPNGMISVIRRDRGEIDTTPETQPAL